MISYRIIRKSKSESSIEKHRRFSRIIRRKPHYYFYLGTRMRFLFFDFHATPKNKTGLITDEQEPCLGL
jgi:hypothetical protein